jgi:sigma-E factor negative regulatory protein RseA
LLELNMSAGSKNEPVAGETLSALIDGEADVGVVTSACAVWRESASTRSAWHTFHLIGDVMRSEDLASTRQRDAAFLERLRARLADEPVVLAPQPLERSVAVETLPMAAQAGRWRRRSWIGPAAVAAGFVAVAGVLVVTRAPTPLTADTTIAGGTTPSVAAGVTPVVAKAPAAADAAADPETQLVRSGQVLRDARLDRYLAAHKQFAGSSALGVPSSFLRSATVDAANR